jgi:anti-sigma factor RsiW
MSDEPLTTDADRIQEELVAFLDDELDEQASERVVERLKVDPAYQQQLNKLQAAWDLLDELPRMPVSESFTQSTVEMVALTAQTEALKAQETYDRKRYYQAIAIGVGALALGIGGYLVISRQLDEPNRKLVQDLPVIENVDLYRVADNVDFLRSLEEASLFTEEPTDVP